LVEDRAHDRANRGYFEEFSRGWKKSVARGKGSAMGSLGQKSQNVHLHLLEAYTGLMRAWPDSGLKGNLADLIDVMTTKILNPQSHHLHLFLDEEWRPEGSEVSYGHDVEFSWLIVEAAEALGDDAVLARVKAEAVKIAAASLREGVDSDGGMMAEGNPSGVSNTFKEWWPQAEAVVGLINAYQISHDPMFLTAAYQSWDFIDRRLIDHKNGEWFIGVAKDGRVTDSVKINFWKCPYHNGRSCLEMSERLRAIAQP
jgi:mannobiose 2-epimerase